MGKLFDTALEWLKKQETQTVVLLANLAMLWGGIYYIIDRGIPSHIVMMQSGYDRQEAAHKEQLQLILDLLRDSPKFKPATATTTSDKTTSRLSPDDPR